MYFGKLPVGENYKTIAPLNESPARVYIIIRGTFVHRIGHSRNNAWMQTYEL